LVFYYVDKNGEENEIGEKTITLSAGEKTTQTIQWTVPSGISANPIIVAKVNPSNYVYESDFSNNAFSLSLNASLPDIVLSINSNRQAIVIPSASGYYSYAQVTTTAYNSGTARANNIVIRVFVYGQDRRADHPAA
jgi:CARDB.